MLVYNNQNVRSHLRQVAIFKYFKNVDLSSQVTATLPVTACNCSYNSTTAANESAQLALTTQEGDVGCSYRSKIKICVKTVRPTTSLLATPTDAVTSVDANFSYNITTQVRVLPRPRKSNTTFAFADITSKLRQFKLVLMMH